MGESSTDGGSRGSDRLYVQKRNALSDAYFPSPADRIFADWNRTGTAPLLRARHLLRMLLNGSFMPIEREIQQPESPTSKLWAVDRGVVVERIVIDAGGLRDSYLGSPESPFVRNRRSYWLSEPELGRPRIYGTAWRKIAERRHYNGNSLLLPLKSDQQV